MDETTLLCEKTSLISRRSKRRVRLGSQIGAGAFGLLCLTFLYLRLFTFRTETRKSYTYPGEQVLWEPCGDSYGRKVECGKIRVPMDQFNLDQHVGKTFEIPLARIRGKKGSKNLVINPGGPGGSGTGFIHRKGAFLSKIIGDDFHLLSFDPRGVNSSRPLASCYPTTDVRARHLMDIDSDSTTDSTKRYAWTQSFVRACEESMGEYGKYINTPQTAADMNSILDAVGQKEMIYWGFSYGTLLGQTYVSLFPERSKRVIIDGVVDQVEWYSALVHTNDFIDSVNVLEGFFEECMNNPDKCALSSLANSTEKLQNKVMAFVEGLKDEPIPVYINATNYGIISYATFWTRAVFGNMYTPGTWFDFAAKLEKLMRGDATSAFLAYGVDDPADATDDAGDVVRLNDGVSGVDYWPQGREAMLETLAPLYNQSPFAFYWNKAYYAKQQWRIPRTHTFKPQPEGIETVHPMLILSTTYDPITPLKSARLAETRHVGSRLLEVKGYGHSSIAVRSVCTARYVRDFLHSGRLPEQNATCEVDVPYFQEPDPEEGVWAKLYMARTEDEQIRVGQDLLSQEPFS